ncbi:MAG TPA: hypothetical protein VK633_10395 [Verrucomicrobiae bacterium]|nr:hypothetical protein [Verrucomicrobiae bacterium]
MSDEINELWEEYKTPFLDFDDLTLARWLSQTLSQLEGRVWRMSHPLVSAYRAAAEIGSDRNIWHKRLVALPGSFPPAECCRAPLLPLFTRDVLNSGLICQHCGASAIEFSSLPEAHREKIEDWAEDYGNVHAVAHYDENQMRAAVNYDETFEKAASDAEQYLRTAALELLPPLLEYYPALIWEDQDECLEVEPKDIITWA